jgi:hypothetical protein
MRKEVRTMTYSKPQLSVLGNAACLIQGMKGTTHDAASLVSEGNLADD